MDLKNYYIAAQFPERGYAEIDSNIGVALDATSEFSITAWIRLSEMENNIDILSCENYFRL